MVRFDIAFSEEAKNDIQNLSDAIMYQYKAPTTAFCYIQGLLDEIKKLRTHAESYSIQASSYFSQYGFNVRRLNYKKMAIIYTVTNNTAYIKRVVPASTITGS
ncbi:MAG TPA: type II toxin-antitoxin system RelE/ParE family toxin [Paludibacter sp.]